MAATITIVAGANTKVLNVTTVNQTRIITALEGTGFDRDPNNTGTPMNDFDYFVAWLKNQYSELLHRAERQAAQQAVAFDPDAVDAP